MTIEEDRSTSPPFGSLVSVPIRMSRQLALRSVFFRLIPLFEGSSFFGLGLSDGFGRCDRAAYVVCDGASVRDVRGIIVSSGLCNGLRVIN